MAKEHNVEVLNEIYQGSHIAVNSIKNIIPKVSDGNFRDTLSKLCEQHYNMAYLAERQLHALGSEAKEVGLPVKASVWAKTQFNTLADTSNTNIAQMMMEGNLMGITEISKKLNHYSDLHNDIRQLSEGFVELQQRHLEIMKKYL